MATPVLAPIITKLPDHRAKPAEADLLEFDLEKFPMEWTRTDTLPLADYQCTFCHGLGLRNGLLDAKQPCNCVLRGIFRAVYQRFQISATKEKSLSRVTFDTVKRGRRAVWGRKDEEFIADFILVSRRTLRKNSKEHQIFRMHFLLAADWQLCCRHFKMERGVFWHAVYRIEQKLGRVFRELLPYPLYPLDEYFNGVMLEHRCLRGPVRRSEIKDDQHE